MNKMVTVWASVLCFAVFADDHAHEEHAHEGHCHEAHDHGHEHAHDHGHEHAHGKGKSVEVAPAIQKVMGLRTVHPEKRRIAGMKTFTGRYELTPEARRSVVTPVAGRLHLNVKALARVKKGDVLFSVSAPDLVARAREIAILEKRLSVYRELKTPNAALESELAVKRTEREALLAGAEEKDGAVLVRAAADGLVEAIACPEDSWLEVGAAVLRLVRPDSLRLKALVAASDAARLADGLGCRVDGVSGELRLGVGEDTGLIPVYAVFPKDSPKGRAGARAVLECVIDDTAAEVLSVPSAAIVRVGIVPTVFMKDEDDEDRFLAVPVVPGVSGGGWTAVSGLPDDDDLEIVTDGAYELRLALVDGGARPAGHFHADGTFHEGADE